MHLFVTMVDDNMSCLQRKTEYDPRPAKLLSVSVSLSFLDISGIEYSIIFFYVPNTLKTYPCFSLL